MIANVAALEIKPGEELRRELPGHARSRLGAAVAPKEIDFRQNQPKSRSGNKRSQAASVWPDPRLSRTRRARHPTRVVPATSSQAAAGSGTGAATPQLAKTRLRDV